MELRFTPLFRGCQLLVPLSIALLSASASANPYDEEVFYPIPQNLVVDDQPLPTANLLANPDYVAADTDDEMTLNAYLFHPDNYDPNEQYPVVILLHGSSSLWSNRNMNNGISLQYIEWSDALTERGYLVIMPDSYHPRGISGGFSDREPHDDPTKDDALCSPNYERPKDVVATLAYLDGRSDVDPDAIGIVSFSQGAQTALNSILDPSVDLGDYVESCYLADESDDYDRPAPDPVRIPNHLPFPRIVVAYYPGCGFFDYHGSPNSAGPNRYMPDTRTKVLMGHGTDDFLMNSNFPVTLVAAARAHAVQEGAPDPFVHHYLFSGAEHSFDKYSVKIEDEDDWWTDAESDDEYAKRIMRKESLRQFAYRLKGEPYLIVPKFVPPGGSYVAPPMSNGGPSDLSIQSYRGKSKLTWTSRDGVGYRLVWQPKRGPLERLTPELIDEGEGLSIIVSPKYLRSGELWLETLPGPSAWDDWRNLGRLDFRGIEDLR